MPSISVIVPVYQAEKFLHRCLDSVARQTFSDWELILVNDGSTDGSAALCDRFAAKDSRVRVFHRKKNQGVSEARNLGLNEARGAYVTFLDADDCYEFHALETLWNLREQFGTDASACALTYLWPDGRQEVQAQLPAGILEEEALREKLVFPLTGDRLTQPVFNGYSVCYLFSTEIIRKNHIVFDGPYLEDELFVLEYFCNAHSLAVTDQPLYRYFLHGESATHHYMADFAQIFSRFMERKEALVIRYGLEAARPQWRESSNWAGLLIAVGNEYARDNPKSIRQRQRAVKEFCQRPEMQTAIRTLAPAGLSANKQMVANLVRGKHFFTLTQLYRLKNRI
ncbi:MAG: glycosyltransferase [Oscillibacter sp.]|nr:glycosyltransferase [Oscillibacter sp.]